MVHRRVEMPEAILRHAQMKPHLNILGIMRNPLGQSLPRFIGFIEIQVVHSQKKKHVGVIGIGFLCLFQVFHRIFNLAIQRHVVGHERQKLRVPRERVGFFGGGGRFFPILFFFGHTRQPIINRGFIRGLLGDRFENFPGLVPMAIAVIEIPEPHQNERIGRLQLRSGLIFGDGVGCALLLFIEIGQRQMRGELCRVEIKRLLVKRSRLLKIAPLLIHQRHLEVDVRIMRIQFHVALIISKRFVGIEERVVITQILQRAQVRGIKLQRLLISLR